MDETTAPEVRRVLTYKVLDSSDISRAIQSKAAHISEVTGLSTNACRILLRQFKWDEQRLLENCYDESAPCAKFFRAAELMDANSDKDDLGGGEEQDEQQGPAAKRTSKTRGVCNICGESVDRLVGLHCKHLYCSDCWRQYIKCKVEASLCDIPCPDSECPILVDEKSLKRLLGINQLQPSKLLDAFTRAEYNDFVSSNRRMRWCPGVGCGLAVMVRDAGCQQVDCEEECGASYCFECGYEWHAPMTCELMRRWQKQCADDSETYNWIHAYTKDCPKCRTAIEKNGGCNHMSCRQPACRYEFCWMCLGEWRAHTSDGQACNRFSEANKTQEKNNKAEDARASLKRYLHYYNRYRNHEQSLKLEANLYEKVAKKVEQLQVKHRFGYIETQFLKDAVDVLNRCRRTLKFTYPFAFYLMPGENTTKLFEDNQQDLELATENLSGYLERDMDTQGDVMVLRQKVQDTARYVVQRRSILLKQSDEGYERDEWKFNSEVFIGTATTAENGSDSRK